MATTKNIQSLERAFSILESFCGPENTERSLKDLSEACNLNKSTTFGLVNTLSNLGYLQHNTKTQKYSLGIRLLGLANAVREQNIIVCAAHPYLEKLSAKYSETVHCAVEDNFSVVYVDKVVAANSLYISSNVGMRNEMYCTGVGKCLLAYMPDEQLDSYLSNALKPMTKNTITDPRQLRRELESIRTLGYAMDNEEIFLGLSCVAVPVFSANSKVLCAISVSGTTSRINTACEWELIDDLKQVTKDLSYGAIPSR